MKKAIILFLSLISSTLAFSQGNFHILPSPQEFRISGSSELSPSDLKTYQSETTLGIPMVGDVLKGLTKGDNGIIKIAIDENLDTPAEGYWLKIKVDEISILAKDEAGLLYAFMTLEQLCEDANEQLLKLPLCKIQDYPLLSYRSIHLDVKHHLETTDYYYKLIDELAKHKVNAIIAEIEDKLAFRRQPIVGSEDAMSIETWENISNYAKERNIDISPLVQGLGHASFILKHEEYFHLRDDPKSDWAFNPLDPETYKVQFDLYLDAMEATPHGKYLHIGGDEVHTTGRNSGKTELELQLIWLNKVCDFAAEHGRTPIFWDDMPLKYAGVYKPMFQPDKSQAYVDSVWAKNEGNLLSYLDQFPKNCIYMRWNYESPESLGNTKAMEWFESQGLETMGATAGQTRWALIPRKSSNMYNIRTFAINSIKSGQKGLLLTLWDDDSPHFETYKRGILGFAETTWAGEKREVAEIKKVFRHRYFSNDFYESDFAFIDELEKQASFWETAFLKKYSRRNLQKMGDKKGGEFIETPDTKKPMKWSLNYKEKLVDAAATFEKCQDIGRTIEQLKKQTTRNIYTLEVYEQINNLIQFSAYSLLELQKFDESGGDYSIDHLPSRFKELRKGLEDVYDNIRILNKPAGYILDSDMHRHMANQTLNFDWQFVPEIHYMNEISKLGQPTAQ